MLYSVIKLVACAVSISLISGCGVQKAPEGISPLSTPPKVDLEPPPLIPLKTLLAPASYQGPRISPDGTRISYIAPLDGVPNFYIAPVDDIKAAKPLTRKTGRGVKVANVSGNVMYRWSPDSRYILFPEDYNGDEKWDIHRIDVATGEEMNLTPSEGIKVSGLPLSSSYPGEVLVAIYEKHPFIPDLYRVDLETGEKRLVESNHQGFNGYLSDHELKPRVALKLAPGGGFNIFNSAGDGRWTPFFDIGFEDKASMGASDSLQISQISRDNTRLYSLDSRGLDTNALVSLDLETGEREILTQDPRVDIGGVLYHPKTFAPQAYALNWIRTRWHALDEAIQPDLDFLATARDGDFFVENRSADDSKWVVRYRFSDHPETFYLYDRPTVKLQELFVSTPELAEMRLSKLYPYVIKARDGLDLVSYLSLPAESDPDGDGRPDKPLPTVMLVHGGPSDERAQYGYSGMLQWLANRGYAVLYVNFRGSAGFGKKFSNAQNLEWGGKMHTDLLDQVDWAVEQGIADPKRVAIMGGSYGGYATLVGMTMTPDVFACGVDLVGPSSLEVFMPHWDVDAMAGVVGDPRTEAGRAHLKARSPTNFAHQTKGWVLVGQGANDSRVPQAQSDNLVKIMQDNDAKVVYALYPDEGHGLYRPENRHAFWGITELFLAQCLGGRAEPLGDKLTGASIEVKAGAELIPGLVDALEK